MPNIVNSTSKEDYLKAILRLTVSRNEFVSTKAIADELAVAQPSVTGMLKKLSNLRLVNYSRYRGAQLTPSGIRLASRILRRHRLVEMFLHKCLKMSWDEIHQEAEVLEHALSDRLEQRIDEWLQYPRFDPHGAPIPDEDGYIEERAVTRLSDMDVRSEGRIAQVTGRDAELLGYFRDRRILPNRRIRILSREKFGGPLKIRVGRETQLIGLQAASEVLVELI